MFWPQKPLILELNTWVWLRTLEQRCGQPHTLAQVPEETLDQLADLGVNLLWLMGVWTRSPRGREQALELLPEFRAALPDISEDDVVGSPYAVHDWQVAPQLGGRAALAELRQRLRARGIGLLLDYVSNHVARDHAWLQAQPDWFIQGSELDLAARPGDFFAVETETGRRIFAHGRDPWFPGWTDSAQVNAFNPDYRKAAREVLFDLAAQCDGLRCDMAMLLRTAVFADTWRGHYDPDAVPETEFWDALIRPLRASYADFRFIAEVYWDMEADMLQLGFDLCYDKTLYDALLHNDLMQLRAQLNAGLSHQQRLLRFTENHDEQRAACAFGETRSRAALALAASLPGALLLHGGQLEGRRIRLPVQLARQAQETTLPGLEAFQRTLLRELRARPFQHGSWRHFDTLPLHQDDESCANLIVQGWATPDDWRLIAVNLSDDSARGRVSLAAWPQIAEGDWLLEDVFDGARYPRAGGEMVQQGLGIVLPPWGAHLFRFLRQ